MDIIRSAIKAIFHDTPLCTTFSLIGNHEEDAYFDRLKDIIRWDQRYFTTTEVSVLVDMIKNNWTVDEFDLNTIHNTELARSFYILNHFTKDVLCAHGINPIVRFNELLRWNELTRFVGEDLMACSFLAKEDLLAMRERNDFAWNNQLEHNNEDLNSLFKTGLTDVHSHLFATGEVFELNWISLMNNLSALDDQNRYKRKMGLSFQTVEMNVWEDMPILNIRQLAILAARLRYDIFQLLFKAISFPEDNIRLMMSVVDHCVGQKDETISVIGALKNNALRTTDNSVFDYAITQSDNQRRDSVFFIHTGERKILYTFFLKYYAGDKGVQGIASFVYLYLQIKNRFRKELVQLNPLIGFENFQLYQKRKDLFFNNRTNIFTRYAIQSSVGKDGTNFLETRLTPSAIKALEKDNLSRCIYCGQELLPIKLQNCVSYVVHFIKEKPKNKQLEFESNYTSLRKTIKDGMKNVILQYRRNGLTTYPLLVGIDAAGSELNCRPEIFGHAFRWARKEGIRNITYHAGEDFYDLIDGMRTIDEAIIFLEYHPGNRFGHALALGINPFAYYAHRHRNVIIPKQVLLDNLVWLYYKAQTYNIKLQSSSLEFIETETHRLLQNLGYGEKVDLYHYWQSMWLRSDDVLEETDSISFASYHRTRECMHPICIEARKIKEAQTLFELYNNNLQVFLKGNQPDTVVMPESIDIDIYALQEKMMQDIEQNGYFIECNPSSNLYIGPFKQYDELPIFRFSEVTPSKQHHAIIVSINTDDSGVFGTSLRKEYSLIALSMMKHKDADGTRTWSNEEVCQYISKIIQYGKLQKFNVDNM